MNKTELIDKLLHLGNTTEMSCSTDRHNSKELAHTLIDEYVKAINYSQCCTTLKDERPITFDRYLLKFESKDRYGETMYLTGAGLKSIETMRQMYLEYIQNL
jgi:hypothetical protein